MNELSQSLIDAAAEADWQAHNAAVLKLIGKRGSLDEKRRMISQARSRAAVVAVLETLAADERKHRFGYPLHDLRRLAAEVKTEEGRA